MRAIVPVLGGLAALAAMAGVMWLVASSVTDGNATTSERLAPSTFPVGPVDRLAESVATDGPLLFPELGTSIGTRSIVIDHVGDVAADGWRIYWAFPADRDQACTVTQVPRTSQFIDCEGRTLDVTELSPPDEGVVPVVVDRTNLVVDLRGATSP